MSLRSAIRHPLREVSVNLNRMNSSVYSAVPIRAARPPGSLRNSSNRLEASSRTARRSSGALKKCTTLLKWSVSLKGNDLLLQGRGRDGKQIKAGQIIKYNAPEIVTSTGVYAVLKGATFNNPPLKCQESDDITSSFDQSSPKPSTSLPKNVKRNKKQFENERTASEFFSGGLHFGRSSERFGRAGTTEKRKCLSSEQSQASSLKSAITKGGKTPWSKVKGIIHTKSVRKRGATDDRWGHDASINEAGETSPGTSRKSKWFKVRNVFLQGSRSAPASPVRATSFTYDLGLPRSKSIGSLADLNATPSMAQQPSSLSLNDMDDFAHCGSIKAAIDYHNGEDLIREYEMDNCFENSSVDLGNENDRGRRLSPMREYTVKLEDFSEVRTTMFDDEATQTTYEYDDGKYHNFCNSCYVPSYEDTGQQFVLSSMNELQDLVTLQAWKQSLFIGIIDKLPSLSEFVDESAPPRLEFSLSLSAPFQQLAGPS
ncbi:unnamed protein product [Nesidiocoris tenuis]|uniref:Uncharacterized protein n=1 Tax=Nesidiocoris tenuis TaxID=355587 RepID=A0A6H5FVA7_9HEMI|nr:unnamed protein product [Nesidiocoris tenuis]